MCVHVCKAWACVRACKACICVCVYIRECVFVPYLVIVIAPDLVIVIQYHS